MSTNTEEGRFLYNEIYVWYKILRGSNPDMYPVICLHGGPGGTHHYLEPLSKLNDEGRTIVFYDQSGNGNSGRISDLSVLSPEYFCKELDLLRKELRLDEIHLFGQSWGGMLAMEYALTKPSGIKSMILADSPSGAPSWITEINRLRSELPEDVKSVLDKHEANGTTDSSEYQEAVMVFYRRHLCRLEEWPESMNQTFEFIGKNPEVYFSMWGPSEFFVTGSLRNWDITSRLGEIDIPALVLGGRYDEATPLITETVHKGIKNSEYYIFENSSHSPHHEEKELFIKLVSDYLRKIEK